MGRFTATFSTVTDEDNIQILQNNCLKIVKVRLTLQHQDLSDIMFTVDGNLIAVTNVYFPSLSCSRCCFHPAMSLQPFMITVSHTHICNPPDSVL